VQIQSSTGPQARSPGEHEDVGVDLGVVWTWQQAIAAVSPNTVRARLRSGRWQQLFRAVYADGDRELGATDWALAAVLASGVDHATPNAAVVAGRSAARVWELPLIDDDDPATRSDERFVHEVITLAAQRRLVMPKAEDAPRPVELRRHRRQLLVREVVRHEAGFWVTAPLRTAVDCASTLTLEAEVCLLDHCLRYRLFTAAELAAAVTERTGRVGGRALAEAVALADGRSESPAETLARLLLLPALPGLRPQVRAADERGRVVARFDLADPVVKLAVEVDGKRGHAGGQMVAKDRARDRRSEALGWVTERCTWYELRCDRDELLARIVARDAQLRARAA
jgi:hypothetical protein